MKRKLSLRVCSGPKPETPCPHCVKIGRPALRCPECAETWRYYLNNERRKKVRGEKIIIRLAGPCCGTDEGPCPRKSLAQDWRSRRCLLCKKKDKILRQRAYNRSHPEKYSWETRHAVKKLSIVEAWSGGRESLLKLAKSAGLPVRVLV